MPALSSPELLIPTPTFNAIIDAYSADFLRTLFQHTAFTEDRMFRYETAWVLNAETALAPLDTVAECFAELRGSGGRGIGLYRMRLTNVLIAVWFQAPTKHISVYVAGHTNQEATDTLTLLKDLMPERPRISEKGEVGMAFWSLTPNGSRAIDRMIAVAPWDKVKDNYTDATREQLTHLMTGFKPTRAGQLVLWHGVPGTGKTHALRALAWEWRKWCSCHYITDPEVFFGASATYMLDVLLMRPDEGDADDDDEYDGEAAPVPTRQTPRGRWRLLILEDSGELMVPDAKQQAGQGLSRLLNVVDGLIGQGLRIMVLVTTNEVLNKLHPAVARPGRCAARIQFMEFTKNDADAWMATKGFTPTKPVPSQLSLADLFALTDYGQIVAEDHTPKVGFNAPSTQRS